MPPKGRGGKMKKVIDIEDRELREELIRRLVPSPPSPGSASNLAGSPSPPAPASVTSAPPMVSALPQPSASADRPSSSAPSPTLRAPPLPLISPASIGVGTSPNSASTASSTTAHSIRCKNLETRDTKPKRKRGVVVGAKTREIVRTTGGKNVVEYSEYHKGLANPEVCSHLSRDIDSCMKDDVLMETPTYADLDKKYKGIVYDHVSPYYEISLNHNGLWKYLQTTAADRYRNWKFDYRQHWLQFEDDVFSRVCPSSKPVGVVVHSIQGS